MGLLTETHLRNRSACPITVPLVELEPADWLILGTIRLFSGQTLRYRFLQLQLTDITFPDGQDTVDCVARIPELINISFGYAYVAIFANYVVNTNPASLSYTGTSADVVTLSSTGIAHRDTDVDELVVTETGDYSWLLVNNTSNANLKLAVVGQVNVDL